MFYGHEFIIKSIEQSKRKMVKSVSVTYDDIECLMSADNHVEHEYSILDP